MKCLLESRILVVALTVGLVGAVSFKQDLSLTVPEKEALRMFRDQVAPLLEKDYMKSDIYLFRWLRARNFNINAAEEMLKENLRWRQDNNIDRILKEDFDDMIPDYPTTLDTHDREGRPIIVIDMYLWDIRSAVVTGRGFRLLRYTLMNLENITQQVFALQREGQNVTQFKAMSNTDGFNMVNHGCILCIPAFWIPFLTSLETYYPGWLDQYIIIEAPEAVQTIIAILKPFMSPQTQEALRVFSANKSQWKDYLDFRVSKEERRAAYGGTKPPLREEQ